jgi:hypothetical protein
MTRGVSWYEDELTLVTIIPHTTALRGNCGEITIAKPFLKSSAFHIQLTVASIQIGDQWPCIGELEGHRPTVRVAAGIVVQLRQAHHVVQNLLYVCLAHCLADFTIKEALRKG